MTGNALAIAVMILDAVNIVVSALGWTLALATYSA